jgi:hypothetical protein
VIDAPVAHVGSIPIEETLGLFAPALLIGFGVASAKLRALLHRVRSRAGAPPARERGAQYGRAGLNRDKRPGGQHDRGEIRPVTSMVQTSALIEPAYVLEIEADAVIG